MENRIKLIPRGDANPFIKNAPGRRYERGGVTDGLRPTAPSSKTALAGFELTLRIDDHLERVLSAGDQLKPQTGLGQTKPVGDQLLNSHTASADQIDSLADLP